MSDDQQTITNDADSSPVADVSIDVKPTAEPSSSSGDTQKADDKKAPLPPLLDAVKAVVKETKSAESSPEGERKQDQNQPAKPEAQKDIEAKAKADEESRFDKHPRFQQLLKERDSFKQDASEYREIDNFVKSNNLRYDEVAEGFKIMALMKNDPARAREEMVKYMDQLDEFVGKKLPADLKNRVDQGLVDHETAAELARTRNQQNHYAAQSQVLQANQQLLAQRQALAQNQAHVQKAVSDWEVSVKSRDPDYAKKQDFILNRVLALGGNNQNITAQQAIQLVERAYSDVNQQMASIIPKRAAITPGPNSSMSSNGNARPVATSLKEYVKQKLAN